MPNALRWHFDRPSLHLSPTRSPEISRSPLAVQLASDVAAMRRDRDPFLRAVAERLAAMPHLGDGLVFQICREVQREHWNPPVVGPLPRKYGTL